MALLPSPGRHQPMEKRSHRRRDQRLREEFNRLIRKAQNSAAMGRDCGDLVLGTARLRIITMRKVGRWQSLTQKLADKPIDLAA